MKYSDYKKIVKEEIEKEVKVFGCVARLRRYHKVFHELRINRGLKND